MLKIAKLSKVSASAIGVRQFSLTAVRALDQKWREEKGLSANPNAFGPLTNMPDYTFLDGRPTPLGSNQKRRLQKQKEIAAKIVALNGELDFAKKRHARLKAEEASERQRVLDNKLKPKGHLLLKKES